MPTGTLVQSCPVSHSGGGGQIGSIVQAPTPPQLVSQEQAVEQSMPPVHESMPPQSTRQALGPQVMGPAQAFRSVQFTRQVVAAEHSTPPAHEFRPSQLTVQEKPGGQTTSAAQAPMPGQETMQVVVSMSHEVHSGGQ